MALIYNPSGRAREYAALACNLYRGCDHACSYCYAPAVLKMTRAAFNKPHTRGDVSVFLKKLEAECEKLQGKTTERVLLCFTCDPYQKLDVEAQVTRRAIQIFHKYGLGVQVLTKGGSRALRDLDLFTDQDTFATTLTYMFPESSLAGEPWAALPHDRMETIRKFHTAGIETWVSMEPVFDVLRPHGWLNLTHDFVDLYKIGKVNYQKNNVDWKFFGESIEAAMKLFGKKYYIKNDLRECMEK